ncbi:MAG: class I SAM-dependent methyltransferase [Nitrospiria bacterium]
MIELDEKRGWIKRFFRETGASYDEVVHRFTFGIDRRWKKKILSKMSAPQKVLDLACGTGILTFGIKDKYPRCHVTGVDITEGYLNVAREKAAASGVRDVTFILSAAEDFVPGTQYDVITSSYLPKYADIPRLMQHLNQMLAPGGIIILHDFTYPSSKALQMTFELYFKCAQPIGALAYPEWKEVLLELPEVIRKSDWVDELVQAMRHEGLSEIQVESLTLQGAALVTAKKDTQTKGL